MNNNSSAIRIGSAAINFSDFTASELDLFEQAINNARKEIKLREERRDIVKEVEKLFNRMIDAGLAFNHNGDYFVPCLDVLDICENPFI